MYYTVEALPSMSLIVPPTLERVVLLRGPAVFEQLVESCGSLSSMARVADVSSLTISRWSYQALGASKMRQRTYRSAWAGYPYPFPALDRIVEKAFGASSSFVGLLEEKYGDVGGALDEMCSRGIGLGLVGISGRRLLNLSHQAGIPPSTGRRLVGGLPYPGQWAALDAVVRHHGGESWLHHVLSSDPMLLKRKIPYGALLCLFQELLSPSR